MGHAARRIVVGYDGSEAAQRALEHAADLVGYGSMLTVVSVGADGAERLLGEARAILGRRRLVARYVDPAEDLVGTAHRLGADLLVVGKRAHNNGVHEARCDVLLVA